MGLFDKKQSLLNKETVKPDSVDKKQITLRTLATASRPADSSHDQRNHRSSYNFDTFGFRVLTLFELEQLSKFSDVLQIIFGTKAREVTRNGYNIEAKNQRASKEQKITIDKWTKRANDNGQSLKDVLKELSKDLDWADDFYLYVAKDYQINEDKEIIGGEVSEIVRLNPRTIEMVLDTKNRLGYVDGPNGGEGQKVYFDLKNRQRSFDPIDKNTGLQNLRAHYRTIEHTGKEMYYENTEILHRSEHNGSITTGFSPLYSLFHKTWTLFTQDRYVMKYYADEQPMKGFVYANTDNAKSLMSALDEIRAKTAQNPHQIYPLAFNAKDKRDPVKFIDMSRNLLEMQYTEGRNEIRSQIGAVYGVTPIYQNDVSTGGGLNNEGLQITVTNRASQVKKEILDGALSFIFGDNFGITDWIVELNPSEEQDEIAELDKEAKEILNAKSRLEIGIKGSVDEQGKFTFEPGKLELEEPEQDFMPFQKAVATVEKPFAGFADFDECVAASQKEDSPEAFCGGLKQPVEPQKKSVQKAAKIPKKEVAAFETTLNKELNKVISKLDSKKKPTEKELKTLTNKLTKNFDRQLKSKSAARYKAIYSNALKEVSKEVGQVFTIDKVDTGLIETLKRSPAVEAAFSNISKDLNSKIKDVITKAYDDPKGFSIDKMVDDLKKVKDTESSNLRNIARTETSTVTAAARSTTYDKMGKDNLIFKHIGPSDLRETQTSKNIKKRVGDGVPWDEYVNIVTQESAKEFPTWTVDKDAPTSHWQTRHVFIGKRKK